METLTSKDGIFTFVKDENKEVKISVGNFVIVPRLFKTFQEAQDYLNRKPWDVIINLIYLALYVDKESQEVTTTKKATTTSKKTAKK